MGIRSALASGGHVIALNGSVPLEYLKNAHRIVDHLDEITLEFIENLLSEDI